MSVLRIPTGDTTSGFGALGQALAQAFDPRLRWEAYELQQRILMQRLQMQELQRKFGARDDLKAKYMSDPNFARAVNTPALQSELNLMIENGTSGADIDKWIASHAYMNEPDVNDPQSQQRRIKEGAMWNQKPWTDPFAPAVGPLTAGQIATTQLGIEQAKAAAVARGTAIGSGIKVAPNERVVGGPGISNAGVSPLSMGWDYVSGTPTVGGGGGASSTSGAAQTPPPPNGAAPVGSSA